MALLNMETSKVLSRLLVDIFRGLMRRLLFHTEYATDISLAHVKPKTSAIKP